VWERFDQAQAQLEQEANELGDLFRNAQAFPDDVRGELETQLRSYAQLVLEKEWPAMAEGQIEPRSLERLQPALANLLPIQAVERC
jgi:hypothetical protein